MTLFEEFVQTTNLVAEIIGVVIQCCAVVVLLVFLGPPMLMLWVALSPFALAIMAACRLSKCFTPQSGLDEVLV